LPVVKVFPEWVSDPERAKFSGRVATFSLWTGVSRDGNFSIPDETVIPLWLCRHLIVCENSVYREKVRMTVWWDRLYFCASLPLVRTWADCKKNTQIAKEFNIISIFEKLLEYRRNWIHVHRMHRNRLPRVMKHCCLTGRRNHSKPLKRLLDTWDRNGSTRGPKSWKIYYYDYYYYYYYYYEIPINNNDTHFPLAPRHCTYVRYKQCNCGCN
jgi:hypothetical protein